MVYHFNPLDARTIGKLCEQHKVTLLTGTPSFTRLYLKSCEPRQFKTITHWIVGAEKLKPELARDIESALGIEPLEGYGCTELSPVVAVNVPREVELPGGRKIHGNRLGTVGLPVPGHVHQDRQSRNRGGLARGRRRNDRGQGAPGHGRAISIGPRPLPR